MSEFVSVRVITQESEKTDFKVRVIAGESVKTNLVKVRVITEESGKTYLKVLCEAEEPETRSEAL